MADGDFFVNFRSNASQFATQINEAAVKADASLGELEDNLKARATEINKILQTIGRGENVNLAENIGLGQFKRLASDISSIMEDGIKRGISNSLRNLRISNPIEIPVKLVSEGGAQIGQSTGRGSRVVAAVAGEEDQSRGPGRPASLGLTADQVASIREARAAMVDLTTYLRKTREAAGQASTGLERLVAQLNGLREATGSLRGIPTTGQTVAGGLSTEALSAVLAPALAQLANQVVQKAATIRPTAQAVDPVNLNKYLRDQQASMESVLTRFEQTRSNELRQQHPGSGPGYEQNVAMRASMEAELFRAMLHPQQFFSEYGTTKGVNVGDLTGDMSRLIYEAGRRLNLAASQGREDLPANQRAEMERSLDQRLGFARLSSEQRESIRGANPNYDPFMAARDSMEVVQALLGTAKRGGLLAENTGVDQLIQGMSAAAQAHTEATTAETAATESATAALTEAAGATAQVVEAMREAGASAVDLTRVFQIVAQTLLGSAGAQGRAFNGPTRDAQTEFYGRSLALREQYMQQATELIPEKVRNALPRNYKFEDTNAIGEVLQQIGGPDLDQKMAQLGHIGRQVQALQAQTEAVIAQIAEPNPRLKSLLDQAFTGQEQIFGNTYAGEDKLNPLAQQALADEKALRVLQASGVRVALPDLVDRLLPAGRLPGAINPSANQIAIQGSSVPATKGRASGFLNTNLGATFFPEAFQKLEAGQDLSREEADQVRAYNEARQAVVRIFDRIQAFKEHFTPVVNELIRQPGFTLGSLPAGTPIRALAEGLMQNLVSGTEINSDEQLSRQILESAARFNEPDDIRALSRDRTSAQSLARGLIAGLPDVGHSGDLENMSVAEGGAYIQAAGLEAQRAASRAGRGGGLDRSAIRGSLGELLQGLGIPLRTANLNRIPEAKSLPGLDRGTPGTRDSINEFNRAVKDMVINLERLVRLAPEEVPAAFEKQYGNIADLFSRLTGLDVKGATSGLAAGQRALARTKTQASRGGANIVYSAADVAGGPKTRDQQVQALIDEGDQRVRDQKNRLEDLERTGVKKDLALDQLRASDLLTLPAATLLEPADRRRFELGANDPNRPQQPTVSEHLAEAASSLERIAGPQGLQAILGEQGLARLVRQEPRFGNIFGPGALSGPLGTLSSAGRLQGALSALAPEDLALFGKKNLISEGEANTLYTMGNRGTVQPIEPGTFKGPRDNEVKLSEALYRLLNGDLQVVEQTVYDRLQALGRALKTAGVSASTVKTGTIDTVLNQIIQTAVQKVELVLRRLAAELSGTGITAIGTAGDQAVRKTGGRPFNLSLGFGGFDEHGRPIIKTNDFDEYLRAAGSSDPRGIKAALTEDVTTRGVGRQNAVGDVFGGLPPEVRERLAASGLGIQGPAPEVAGRRDAAVAQQIEGMEQLTAVIRDDTSAEEKKLTATEAAAQALVAEEVAVRRSTSVTAQRAASAAALTRARYQEQYPEIHQALAQGDFLSAATAMRQRGIGTRPDLDIATRTYNLSPDEHSALKTNLEALGQQARSLGPLELSVLNISDKAKMLLGQIREIATTTGITSEESVRALAPLVAEFLRLNEVATGSAKGDAAATSQMAGRALGLNPTQFTAYKQSLDRELTGIGGTGGGGGGGLPPGIGELGPAANEPGGVLAQLLFGKGGNGGVLERQLLSIGRTWTRFASDMLVFAGFAKLQQIVTQALQLEKEFTRMGAALEAINGNQDGLASLRTNLAGIATSLGAPLNDVVKTASEFTGVFSKVKDIEFATKITEQLKLISLGALSTEEAFRGISSIISGYQANPAFAGKMQGVAGLAQVGNQVTQASSITGTNVADIIQGVGRLAPEAASLNIDPATLIGLMADVTKRSGQPGEAAGEQLSRAFATLQTSKVQGILEKTGIATEDQFNRGQYGQVLTSLLEKFPTLSHSQQAAIRETIGTGRQAAVINAMLGDSHGVLKDINNVAENSPGALDRRTNAIIKTFSQQISIFEQNIQALANLIIRSGVLDGLGLLFIALNKVFSLFITVGNGLNGIVEKAHLTFLRDLLAGFIGLNLAGSLLSRTFSSLPRLVNTAARRNVAGDSTIGAFGWLLGGDNWRNNRLGGAIGSGAGAFSRVRSELLPVGMGPGLAGALGTRFAVGAALRQVVAEVGAGLGAATGGVAKLGIAVKDAFAAQTLDSMSTALVKFKATMQAGFAMAFLDPIITGLRRLRGAIIGLGVAEQVSAVLKFFSGGLAIVGSGLGKLFSAVGLTGFASRFSGSFSRAAGLGADGVLSKLVFGKGPGVAASELRAERVAANGVGVGGQLALPGMEGLAAAGPEAAAGGGVAATGLLSPPGIVLAAVAGGLFATYSLHKENQKQQKSIDDAVKQVTTGGLTPKQENELGDNLFKNIAKKHVNPDTATQLEGGFAAIFRPTRWGRWAKKFFTLHFNDAGAAFLGDNPGAPQNQAQIDSLSGRAFAAVSSAAEAGFRPGRGAHAVSRAAGRIADAKQAMDDINAQLKPLEDQKTFQSLVDAAGKNKLNRALITKQLTAVKAALENRKNALQSILDGYDGIFFSFEAATSTNSVVGAIKGLSSQTLSNPTNQRAVQALVGGSNIPSGAKKYVDTLTNPKSTAEQRNKANLALDEAELNSLTRTLQGMAPGDNNYDNIQNLITTDLADIDQLQKAAVDDALQTAQSLATYYANRGDYAAQAGQLSAAIAAINKKLADPHTTAAEKAQLLGEKDQAKVDRALAGAAPTLNADQTAIAGATGAAARDAAQAKYIQDQLNAVKGTGKAANQKRLDLHNQQIQIGISQAGDQMQAAQAAGQVNVAQLQAAGYTARAQAEAAAVAEQQYSMAVGLYGAGSAEANQALASAISAQASARDALIQSLKTNLDLRLSQIGLKGGAYSSSTEAKARLNEAERELQTFLSNGGAAGSDQYKQLLAQVNNARRASIDARVQDTLDTLDFNQQIGRISASQEIAALRKILKARDLTIAERRNILLKIKGLADQNQGQWNLGDIKVPTPYEMRRFIAGSTSPNGGTTMQNVTINVTQAPEFDAVLAKYFGTGTVSRTPTSIRRV